MSVEGMRRYLVEVEIASHGRALYRSPRL